MIAVDTNVLARFYCDDPDDPEAKRQRPTALRIMTVSSGLFVPLTVILEFEWVLRGFYNVDADAFCGAPLHLLGMPHVTVERGEAVNDALVRHRRGLDFADALHSTCSAACEGLVTFDDRRFVRRAARLNLAPVVTPARQTRNVGLRLRVSSWGNHQLNGFRDCPSNREKPRLFLVTTVSR